MCPLAHEYYDVDHFVFVCYVCALTFFFNLHFMWRLMKKKQQHRDNYHVAELNVRARTQKQLNSSPRQFIYIFQVQLKRNAFASY